MHTVTAIPHYFGPAERPLFGFLQLPASWSGARVIVCAPLGYEGQFSYLTLQHLATSLAANTSSTVLRFDYDGCGDSAGTDEDSQRVQRWIASVHAAIDELARIAPGQGPTILIGLRAGALLAATVAEQRKDIDALVLWAPTLSGRLFLREQRAFSAMAHVTATTAGKDREKWGENGFEANGYVFTNEAATDFERLDLKRLQLHSRTRVLVLNRTDIPVRSAVPQTWRDNGVIAEEIAVDGYAQLMEPPWLSKRPNDAIARIENLVRELTLSARMQVHPIELCEVNTAARSLGESAVWYDETKTRFGILTEPDRPTSTALILITSTFGYRVGPNRMNVACARRMAKLGIATLRIDLSCIGESFEAIEKHPNAPYDLDAIKDVDAAIAFMKERGYERVALGGICAGAFLAWYTALRNVEVSKLVLVNPETFEPIQYLVEDHTRMLQAPVTWREQFQREKKLSRKLAILLARGRRIAAVALQHARSRLPLAFGGPILAKQIRSLERRMAVISIIFSCDDFGIKKFFRALGPNVSRFERRGALRLQYIDGPDHSFTPRWANQLLIQAIALEVAHWSGAEAAEEQTAPAIDALTTS